MKKNSDILKRFICFITDENGATVIEYVLIAALVSTAAIGAFGSLQSNLTTMYVNINSSMER